MIHVANNQISLVYHRTGHKKTRSVYFHTAGGWTTYDHVLLFGQWGGFDRTSHRQTDVVQRSLIDHDGRLHRLIDASLWHVSSFTKSVLTLNNAILIDSSHSVNVNDLTVGLSTADG